MKSKVKTLAFWVLLLSVAMLLLMVLRTGQSRKETTINFTEFVNKLKEDQVKEVTISGREVHGSFRNSNLGFTTQIPASYSSLYDQLIEHHVFVRMKDASSGGWVTFLVQVSPFLLLIAVWFAALVIVLRLRRAHPGRAAD